MLSHLVWQCFHWPGKLKLRCMLHRNKSVVDILWDVLSLSSLLYTVSQNNDTDVAHYNIDTDQPILTVFAEMLLRELAIKRFGIPPLLTNVLALPGETWTPEKTRFLGFMFMFPQVVPQTVRRGGTTNHHLIAYSLSNISAKKLPKSVDVRWSYSVQH